MSNRQYVTLWVFGHVEEFLLGRCFLDPREKVGEPRRKHEERGLVVAAELYDEYLFLL